MGKIRVLVVDDSPTVRGHLVHAMAADPDLDVVGEARDGESAVDLCQRMRPDVVTMDIVLPGMSGLAATEQIMAHCPTPILVVSSPGNRGEHFQTCDALAAGAVDVLDKPNGEDTDRYWEDRLVSAVKLVSRIRVITHPRVRMTFSGRSPAASQLPDPRTPPCQLVCVGASTGGPQAVLEVFRALPSTFDVPVLLVLHINEPFGIGFADWLTRELGREVRYPTDGEPVAAAAGRVFMAPPGRHLEVRDRRLHLSDAPERHSCRPSIDVLFESVARDHGASAAGCLLTGMGRDGAEGLLAIRAAGGLTIAQDEATSVVYGMPREAAMRGAAKLILPVDRIGTALAALHRPPDRGSP
jgi:two-component system chemotaxis response regulator CheB